MSISFDIKMYFLNYLVERKIITQEEAQSGSSASIDEFLLAFSDEFKSFLAVNNIPEDSIFQDSNAENNDTLVQNADFSDNEHSLSIDEDVQILKDIIQEEQDNYISEDGLDLIVEDGLDLSESDNFDYADIARDTLETGDLALSDENTPELEENEQLSFAERMKLFYEKLETYETCEDILNDMYMDENVIQYIDFNEDGEVDDEEKELFEKYIQGDDEELDIEKLKDAWIQVKTNEFDIGDYNDFRLSQIEDVNEDPEDQVNQTQDTTPSTSVGGSGGGSGGGYGGGISSGGSVREKTLSDMSEDELKEVKSGALQTQKEQQNKLQNVVNGTDSGVEALKNSADEAYNNYYDGVNEVSPELASKLKDAVDSVNEQEKLIGDKQIEISAQEIAVLDAEQALSNAESKKELITEMIQKLGSVETTGLTSEQASDLASKKSTAQERLSAAEEEITVAQENLDKQKEILEEKNNELSQMQTELQSREEIRNGINDEIVELAPELSSLKDAYMNAKNEYNNKKAEAIKNTKAEIVETQKYINEVNAALYNLQELKPLKKELKFSKSGELFDKDIDITSEYVKHDGVMPYLVIGPEDPDPNVEYPVLVYLHGAGEFGTSEDKLRGSSLPYVLINGELRNGQDIDLANFNGYVICPQANNTNWTDPNKVQALIGVLDDFSLTHNIDMDHIALSGHSMGGIGAQYIGHEFEMNDYGYKFCKIGVISGYEVNVNIEEMQTPMRGWVDVNDSSYMKGYFKRVVESKGETVEIYSGQGHGYAPEYAYIIDNDHDGCSDYIQWLFGD